MYVLVSECSKVPCRQQKIENRTNAQHRNGFAVKIHHCFYRWMFIASRGTVKTRIAQAQGLCGMQYAARIPSTARRISVNRNGLRKKEYSQTLFTIVKVVKPPRINIAPHIRLMYKNAFCAPASSAASFPAMTGEKVAAQ